MRQYELAIRIAQIHHLVDERKYKKALAVIQTLDMRQVRSFSDLKACAEVYTKTEQYDAAKATYLRVYRHSRTRRILYRLIYLSIRTNALDEAEMYFKEFVRMNPNARDVLILRYRLDKAAGVPIGRLIETLQELKQEEYIEEWAYELAKLYHRAGRKQECLEECEDILLWFGTGEIVERAKILIDHLKEKNPAPYYDDKDFTMRGEEEPNPDDTGSLPDIKSFIKERKVQKEEEKATASEDKWESFDNDDDDFIDDYDDDDSLQDGMDLSQMAKGGIQKLSGLLRHGKKDEEKTAKKVSEESAQGIVEKLEMSLEKNLAANSPERLENQQERQPSGKTESRHPARELEAPPAEQAEQEPDEKTEDRQNKNTESEPGTQPEIVQESEPGKRSPEYVPLSQSGTGITQDLAKEISAIYDMEHREQLKEKEVKVVNDKPNIATNVVERMTQAIQRSANKGYIPMDVEEIQGRKNATADDREIEEQAGDAAAAPQKSETEILKDLLDEQIEDPVMEKGQPETQDIQAEGMPEQEELPEIGSEKIADEPAGVQKPVLEDYHAPEIPVVQTSYMEMPEIAFEDLPTTRALHQSFKNILRLIEGELDPSHFVLMGNGTDGIVGVSKQIVRVMKETGYLSKGRIAKINTDQLNKMDLIAFREQLKGNCLLIENAADLLFPTITKIFSIMEEYYGDFVVILADEGTTLDQLFRFVPVLAKKFKYIIDISKYTKEDYE